MATNIQSIVADQRDFLTRTNAGWFDGFPISVAGSIASIADAGNVGTGQLYSLTFSPNTPVGIYRVVITIIDHGATIFELSTVDGSLIKTGIVGAPLSGYGITFTLMQGPSNFFAVGDGFTISVLPVPLNITGIRFDMQLRATLGSSAAYPAAAALTASTTGTVATLINGGPLGVVSIQLLHPTMRDLSPGLYDYDLLASADGYRVVAFAGTVEHALGVTLLPA